MLQVFVAGHESRGAGSVVIGAEQRIDLRLATQDLNGPSQGFRRRAAVGIDEKKHLAASPSGTQVPCRTRALPASGLEDRGAELGSDFRRVIRRTVVHDDQLPVRKAGCGDGLQAGAERLGTVENGHDH